MKRPPRAITARELKTICDMGREQTIVDVRPRHEFEQCHLPGAVHVPFGERFDEEATTWIANHGPVVTYGDPARSAAERLASLGMDDVLWLSSGIAGWLQESFPVERRGVRAEP